MPETSEVREMLTFALRLTDRASQIALEKFQKNVPVEEKEDGSVVTAVDRQIEEELRHSIREDFSDDAVLGEEFGEESGSSGRRWIVDPIDGTFAFVRGVPLFGIMIALEEAGEPILGVVRLPALGETVYAGRGLGCWWITGERHENPTPIRARVSSVGSLSESLILTAGHEYFRQAGQSKIYEQLIRGAGYQRGWSDCYGQILVATGRADALVEPVMKVWDAAPFLSILSEAGGEFTDWKGNRTIQGGNSVSTNGKLHHQFLALVQRR
jgi:histidinol-phosphatase